MLKVIYLLIEEKKGSIPTQNWTDFKPLQAYASPTLTHFAFFKSSTRTPQKSQCAVSTHTRVQFNKMNHAHGTTVLGKPHSGSGSTLISQLLSKCLTGLSYKYNLFVVVHLYLYFFNKEKYFAGNYLLTDLIVKHHLMIMTLSRKFTQQRQFQLLRLSGL